GGRDVQRNCACRRTGDRPFGVASMARHSSRPGHPPERVGRLVRAGGRGCRPHLIATERSRSDSDAETGFVHLRVRYYDPATGLFLTVDPAYSLTQFRYGYADGDPLDKIDPSGLGAEQPK